MTIRIARLLAAIGALAGALGLLASLLLSTTKASAQPMQIVCMPLAGLVDLLKLTKGEEKAWEGTSLIRGHKVVTMLFQSPKNTWTLAATQGTQACIMGMGTEATPVVIGRDA